MAFFANFGQVAHTLPSGEQILINDITKWATIEAKYKNDPRLNITYSIKDGESPWVLSNRMYDSVRFWWTVLQINGMGDEFTDWPLDNDALDKHVYYKYWGVGGDAIHHYEDPYGNVVDPYALSLMGYGASPDSIIQEQSLIAITNYEYEFNVNEKKRDIILVDPDQIGNLEKELTEAFL